MTRRAPARLRRSIALAALAACAPGLPNGAADEVAPAIASRDAVVRVGAYAIVPAVAVSQSRAFAVGEDGVAVYDRGARRWLPPIPLALRDLAVRVGRVSAATNLIGDVVWVASQGRVFVVGTNLRSVFATPFIGEARAIRVERGGANAYVLTDRWWQVGTTGDARPVAPGEMPPDALLMPTAGASDPAIRRAIDDPLLTRDEALRTWPVISAARGATSSDVWLGTAGGGVFHVDPDFHRSEQLAFGLREGGVLALARTADGIVAAEYGPVGAGVMAPGVVTEGSDDLTRWRWHALSEQVGAVRSLALRGRSLCVVGENGAGIVELPSSATPALPATVVHVVALPAFTAMAARDGCVVGTLNGVTVIPWPRGDAAGDSLWTSSALPAVNALAAAGDTIWAGTRDGVYTLVGGRPTGPARSAVAGWWNVTALALVPGGLAVAGRDGVSILSSATVERIAVPVASVGNVRALAADDRTLWVGGEHGALAIDLATRGVAPVPLEAAGVTGPPLPGGDFVNAIVLAPGVAWIGTAAGLVRVGRGADGLPR